MSRLSAAKQFDIWLLIITIIIIIITVIIICW